MQRKVDAESSSNDDTFTSLLSLTSRLRKYQEEEALLFERGMEQRREFAESSKYLESIMAKRAVFSSILSDGDVLAGLDERSPVRRSRSASWTRSTLRTMRCSKRRCR